MNSITYKMHSVALWLQILIFFWLQMELQQFQVNCEKHGVHLRSLSSLIHGVYLDKPALNESLNMIICIPPSIEMCINWCTIFSWYINKYIYWTSLCYAIFTFITFVCVINRKEILTLKSWWGSMLGMHIYTLYACMHVEYFWIVYLIFNFFWNHCISNLGTICTIAIAGSGDTHGWCSICGRVEGLGRLDFLSPPQSVNHCMPFYRKGGRAGIFFPLLKKEGHYMPFHIIFPFHGQSQHYKLLAAPGCSSQSPYSNKKNKSRARGPRHRHEQEQGARRLDDGWWWRTLCRGVLLPADAAGRSHHPNHPSRHREWWRHHSVPETLSSLPQVPKDLPRQDDDQPPITSTDSILQPSSFAWSGVVHRAALPQGQSYRGLMLQRHGKIDGLGKGSRRPGTHQPSR